jgi:hypothetical protein
MKNKLLFDYTISDKFLALLGIKREDVYDFNSNRIYFLRDNKKLLVYIDSNYYTEEKEGDAIHLKLIDPDISFILSYGLELFQIRNIKDESDFIKFREMMELYLRPKITINLNNIT